MRRSLVFIGLFLSLVLLLFLALFLTVGWSRPAGYDSPEEAFTAEQTARRNHQFAQVYDCLTPESQQFGVGMILAMISVGNVRESHDKKIPQGFDAWDVLLRDMGDLARRHGVDVATLPDDVSIFDADGCLALAAQFSVDDPRYFYADYWQAYAKGEEVITGEKLHADQFTLTEIKYRDNYAYAIKQHDSSNAKQAVVFQQLHGKWFVDDVERLRMRFPDLRKTSKVK